MKSNDDEYREISAFETLDRQGGIEEVNGRFSLSLFRFLSIVIPRAENIHLPQSLVRIIHLADVHIDSLTITIHLTQ